MNHSEDDEALPPSLPPFVKYVLLPAVVGGLWFLLGAFGVVLFAVALFGWYVFEGYATHTPR